MSGNKNAEKITSLTKYVEDIETRLKGKPSKKHAENEAGWRAFLEIDLKKAKAKLENLKING